MLYPGSSGPAASGCRTHRVRLPAAGGRGRPHRATSTARTKRPAGHASRGGCEKRQAPARCFARAGWRPSGPVYGPAGRRGTRGCRSRPRPASRCPRPCCGARGRCRSGSTGCSSARRAAGPRASSPNGPATCCGPRPVLRRPARRAAPARRRPPELTDEEILASPYGRHGMPLHRRGRPATSAPGTRPASSRSPAVRRPVPRGGRRGAPPAQSGRTDPILVAPIRGSDHYQILDGHHRLAARGRARRADGAASSPNGCRSPRRCRTCCCKMSWLDGTSELYQPIDGARAAARAGRPYAAAPTGSRRWPSSSASAASPGSYLDVASCYGWFVAEMGRAGFDAKGMERDPLAVPLGQAGVRPRGRRRSAPATASSCSR